MLFFHCSIDNSVELIAVNDNLCKKLLLFHIEMISAWGNVFL